MKFLLALFFLAAQGQATVLGYYQGETSPGRLVDGSIAGNNLTQVVDPGNPSSPTPPEGSKWLAGGVASGSSYYVFDPTKLTNAIFVGGYTIQWYQRTQTGAGNYQSVWYVDDAVNYERIAVDVSGGNARITIESSAGNEGGPYILAAVDTNPLVRLELAATGATCSVYSNCVLVGTFTRLATLTLATVTVSIQRSPIDALHYMDAFMVASGASDTYLGPNPCAVSVVGRVSPYLNSLQKIFSSPLWGRK